jgi:ketosteroid isomerase-like protein
VTSERAEAVKAAYEADLADFDLLAGILHPEVEFQTNWPGLAPAVYGVEGVRRFAEGFLEPWEWVQFDVREVVEVDEETVFVAAHVRGRGQGSGVEAEMDIYDVLTFRDGRLVLRRTWPDRAPAIAALGIDNSSVE